MENLVKPNHMILVQLQNSIRDNLIEKIVLEYNQDLVVDEEQDILLVQSLYHEEEPICIDIGLLKLFHMRLLLDTLEEES
jgi:hypothetical protein